MNNFNIPEINDISPSFQQSLVQNQSTRNRSRAGTLPSSFLSPNSILNGYKSLSNSPLNIANQESLSVDSMSMGLSSAGATTSSSPNDQTGIGSRNNTRVRSGSLFSANSIWNDDNLTSMHSDPNNNFLTPMLTPSSAQSQHTRSTSQVNSSSIATSAPMDISTNNRNRSYTTTAAIPSVTFHSFADAQQQQQQQQPQPNRVLSSPFATVSNKNTDMNALLDNLMMNMNSNQSSIPRHRSQTYSGTTPTIPEASLQQQQINYQQQQHANHSYQKNSPPSILQHQQQQFPPVIEQQNQSRDQPVLIDDFDFSQLIITTNFENPSLGPTKYLLFDNLPLFIDSTKLYSILANSLGTQRSFGNVYSIRVTTTTTSKLALVECTTVDIAMTLKANFNHLEIVSGVTLYVAFAKIQSETNSVPPPAIVSTSTISSNVSVPPVQAPQQVSAGPVPATTAHTGASNTEKPSPTDITGIQPRLIEAANTLSHNADVNKIISMINKCIAYPDENFQDNFGPLPDPIPLRQFDSPKLRELRKVLENNEATLAGGNINGYFMEPGETIMTQLELEALCLAMLDELPELCYDYLGNTIVQKLFTLVESPLIKLMMVKEIAPYLTQLSIHKNGTWAIQKIINLCHEDKQQMYLIGASLKPYAIKLFNDQFGNYVIQGCIKFKSPFNDFVIEAMLHRFLEISFGRFGARCIRTILESAHHEGYVSQEQVLLVAGLIIEYANELVVNSNGSLLITWFLDTFNDSETKIDLLTKKFLPHLKSLCIHKLANLTILKILNNRTETKTRQIIIDEIFKPQNLEYILQENENSSGALFIYKILSNPTLHDIAQIHINEIRRILLELPIVNFQNYKKLMDEVGISNRGLNRNGSNPNNMKRNRRIRNGGKHDMLYPQGPQPIPIPMQPQHYYMPPPPPQQQQQQQQQQQPPQQYMPQMQPYVLNAPPPYLKQQQMFNPQQMQQQQQQQQQAQQDMMVMQQLEQLSLSSAALGYNSNPGTPTIQRESYMQ
ncbi:uncharacterized protein J8A68_003438 [[Candida] subhashii]|uniref:PUM-HD domain-containing protein n=1 Tax=[Candida] subhashii TaxID=561895 RepID=A0A8J5QM25_9ASCO|nr:uncharacterized protein J8A68_003438 [[Candida] subhashii]KAG7663056.1 hypothetical protein J8A68_003438 [[Candida] subhashii]